MTFPSIREVTGLKHVQGHNRIAKLKIASDSIVIGPRGLECETNLYKVMGWESFHMVRLVLGTPPSRSNEDSQT